MQCSYNYFYLIADILQVLDSPDCSTDLSPIKNMWRIFKQKHVKMTTMYCCFKTCLQEKCGRMKPAGTDVY